MGYTSEVTPSAELALDFLEKSRVELMFVDIGLPGARGDELIEIVSRQYPRVIIIAVSADADQRTIISVLREHKAYDFLRKPFDPGQVQDLLERVLKMVPLRQGGLSFLESEQQYYANMFAAFNWKQEIRARHSDRIAGFMLRELYRTLFQGSGPGSLLATVQLMLPLLEAAGADVKSPIEGELIDLLRANSDDFARLSECIRAAVEVLGIQRNVEERQPADDVCRALRGIATDVCDRLGETERKFNLGALPEQIPPGRIPFDRQAMEIVIQELLVNATKYSRPGDTILILMNLVGARHLDFKVVNPAYATGREEGESEEIDMMLFAPFYRLAREESPDFPEEKFGFGLGLSVVRKLVELHLGSVTLLRIKNYARTEHFDDICATVRLPIEVDGSGSAF